MSLPADYPRCKTCKWWLVDGSDFVPGVGVVCPCDRPEFRRTDLCEVIDGKVYLLNPQQIATTADNWCDGHEAKDLSPTVPSDSH